METRHSRIVSLFRIVILSDEMETIPQYPIPGYYSRKTELSDNPLICPVITGHQPMSIWYHTVLDESLSVLNRNVTLLNSVKVTDIYMTTIIFSIAINEEEQNMTKNVSISYHGS